MWPKLNFPPINLWNVPYMFKERTIIDKILDEELRFYIKMGKYADVVYVGIQQFEELGKELGMDHIKDAYWPGLTVIRVDRADYLRVG